VDGGIVALPGLDLGPAERHVMRTSGQRTEKKRSDGDVVEKERSLNNST
jgi:hypothetical protein